MFSHQGGGTMQDSSLDHAWLSALTFSTSSVVNATKWCPAAGHLKQDEVGCAKMSVCKRKTFIFLIHTSFVPSVHLLDPAAASAWVVGDTKVMKLQTSPFKVHKTGHKASILVTVIVMEMSAPSHWVLVGYPCPTSACDLQEPLACVLLL